MKHAFLLGVKWAGKFPFSSARLTASYRYRIANDDELNLVLLGLVKYLGNGNRIVSGAAFNEVSQTPKFYHTHC